MAVTPFSSTVRNSVSETAPCRYMSLLQSVHIADALHAGEVDIDRQMNLPLRVELD